MYDGLVFLCRNEIIACNHVQRFASWDASFEGPQSRSSLRIPDTRVPQLSRTFTRNHYFHFWLLSIFIFPLIQLIDHKFKKTWICFSKSTDLTGIWHTRGKASSANRYHKVVKLTVRWQNFGGFEFHNFEKKKNEYRICHSVAAILRNIKIVWWLRFNSNSTWVWSSFGCTSRAFRVHFASLSVFVSNVNLDFS